MHSHSPWDSLADDRHGAALPLPLHVLSIHGCRARAHLERGRATSRVVHRHPAALALPLPVRLLLVSSFEAPGCYCSLIPRPRRSRRLLWSGRHCGNHHHPLCALSQVFAHVRDDKFYCILSNEKARDGMDLDIDAAVASRFQAMVSRKAPGSASAAAAAKDSTVAAALSKL